MENYYPGELVFDDRNQNELFGDTQPLTPFYADVLNRWAIGNSISMEEQRIIVNILILNPDYILQNGKSKEFIEMIRYSFKHLDLQNPNNPEKGLFLYTLFFFLLKTNAGKDALQVLCELEDVFTHYNYLGIQVLDTMNVANTPIYLRERFFSAKHFDNFKNPYPIQTAYFEIISCVMDTNELLSIEPDFNFTRLPLPNKYILDDDCRSLRSEALDLYKNKKYKAAIANYRRLRIEGFELSGTLTHMARIELRIGNIDQAQTHLAMAWRHRENAAPYVLARMLFMNVFLNMLQSKPFEIWLACLKFIIKDPGIILEWEMGQLISKNEKNLKKEQVNLLKSIFTLITTNSKSDFLISSDPWNNLIPIPMEKWPKYDVILN